MSNFDWRTQAACRDHDPELFFPIGTTGPAIDQANRAKAVCADCPVISSCLAWAIESGERDGVWGGHTERERRSLTRRLNRGRRSAGAA